MLILPFPAMCFMVGRGFVYTISLYVYAYRRAFNCVLQQIVVHLAANNPNCGTNGGS